MSRPVVVVGCGGFGREVLSLVSALRARGSTWELAGFVDDAPSEAESAKVAALGSTVFGDVASLTTRTEPFAAVIAIGSPAARRSVVDRLAGAPVTYPVLVHPDATVGPGVELGEGTLIAAGARLSCQISVGRHVHVDQNATVGHDCDLGDFVRLNPQACVSGAVTLGPGTVVGASATVLQGLKVGGDAVVGAGAVVVSPVPDRQVVKGVPAR